MAPTSSTVLELERRRAALRAQLAQVGDLRPGSLVARYRKCGKGNCRCAAAGAAGHGPSWSLTRAVGGTTVTTVLPAGPAVEATRQHLAEYQRFRALTRAFVEVSAQLCTARLAAAEAAAEPAAEKKGSARPSRRRSRGRSRP